MWCTHTYMRCTVRMCGVHIHEVYYAYILYMRYTHTCNVWQYSAFRYLLLLSSSNISDLYNFWSFLTRQLDSPTCSELCCFVER